MTIEQLAALGRASLAWLWIPMIAWTVLAALALTLLRTRRTLHPLVAYRLRQALLIATNGIG